LQRNRCVARAAQRFFLWRLCCLVRAHETRKHPVTERFVIDQPDRDDAPKTSSTGRWLHGFAVLLAIATLFLIGIGGLMTSHGAGMAVPD